MTVFPYKAPLEPQLIAKPALVKAAPTKNN
jgi:hypothetical protein